MNVPVNIGRLLVTVVFLCSCHTARQQAGTSKTGSVKTEDLQLKTPDGQDKIVFLTMQITLRDSAKDEYELLKKNVIYADGSMKKMKAGMQDAEQQYLYCEVQDAAGKMIDVLRVENPLLRIFETSDEHTGRFEKHLVRQVTGTFVLRFNLTRETKYLSFYKLSANKLKKIYHAQL